MTSAASLTSHLQAALRDVGEGALCVAFSGGPDSSALLHALAHLPDARQRDLRALHVDHGLHPRSAAWAEHCRRFAAELGVPLEVQRVHVETGAGIGLEAAARQARYAVFTTALRAGELLVLAQHSDDQIETVLLKLLRGAGPEGLGGMRAIRPLGSGRLWRPLLALPRSALQAYVAQHALACIDDPSNRDLRLSRNYLRHEIIPRLQQHWPQASQAVSHSARLSQSAAATLRAAWEGEFERLHDTTLGCLDAVGWLALPVALRQPLLDHWLHQRGLPAPSWAQRKQIERQCHARAGQSPCVRWPGVELHIWKSRLWALPPRDRPHPDWCQTWHGEPLTLPDEGRLFLQPARTLPDPLQVRLRRGGEKIKPAGDRHTREVRDLFQKAALPPWQRETCPYIYSGSTLIAVGDRWLTAQAEALFQTCGVTLHWQPAF